MASEDVAGNLAAFEDASSIKKAKISKTNPHYCCVVGCKSKTSDRPTIKLFAIPAASRNSEQRQLWLKAINRVSKDGSPWVPGQKALVCSLHFVSGKPR